MSDGREERQDQETRRQQEQRKDHQDDLDRYPPDQWKPERTDS